MPNLDMPCDAHELETTYLTPLKAVRQHCLSCCNGSFLEINLCSAKSCPLWPFRHGRRRTAEDKSAVVDWQLHPQERDLTGNKFRGTGLRAIRLRCLDCSGNSDGAVRSCRFGPGHPDACTLHPYRLGGNPNIKRSDEWKAKAAERLVFARAAASANPIETSDHLSDRGSDRAAVPSGMAMKESALSLGHPAAAVPHATEMCHPKLEQPQHKQGWAARSIQGRRQV